MSPTPGDNTAQNLVDLLLDPLHAAEYESLLNAASFAGLVETLKDEKLMLFAPSQATFDDTFPDVFRWNKAKLTKVLSNHVSANQNPLTDTVREVETLTGTIYRASDKQIEDPVIDITPKGATLLPAYLYQINGFLPIDDDLPEKNLFDTAAENMGDLKNSVSDEMENSLKAISKKCPTDSDFCFEQGYTVFLPSADAFSSLVADLTEGDGFKVGVTEYLADGGLDAALKAHTVGNAAPVTNSGANSGEFTSLFETGITLDFEATTVTIAGVSATVDLDSMEHQNGNGHLIDKVLQFPRSSTVDLTVATNILSSLEEKLIKYELDTVLAELSRSTIFAPTDDVFKQLDAYERWNPNGDFDSIIMNIIKHHVLAEDRLYKKDLPVEGAVSGKSLMDESIDVSQLSIIKPDVLATNGNIHIVDRLIIPESLKSKVPSVDIADVAQAFSPKFFSYLELFPDLVDLLTSTEEGDIFTIWAPRDEAFAALSAEDIEYLTADDNKLLKELLVYHIIQGTPVWRDQINQTKELTTMAGTKMTLTVSSETKMLFVDGIEIPLREQKVAYQGVVHLVDKVIIPPGIGLPSGGGSAAASLTISAAAMAVASFFAAAF